MTIRVTLGGLLSVAIIGCLGFWTAHSFVNGNVLSPPIWLAWLVVSAVLLIGSLRWQLAGLMGLSNRPRWPMALALVACLASFALLVVAVSRHGVGL